MNEQDQKPAAVEVGSIDADLDYLLEWMPTSAVRQEARRRILAWGQRIADAASRGSADAKDAERYRWLRLEISAPSVIGVSGALVELWEDKAYDDPDELDIAIDAAITAISKEQDNG